MKTVVKFSLFLAFLVSPLIFMGQSLTGLWIGSTSNDSSTVRKEQSFEIALTEYRGKVYGYSRSEFIVNDTLYYIVKRVKGTIEGDRCEVVDDDDRLVAKAASSCVVLRGDQARSVEGPNRPAR